MLLVADIGNTSTTLGVFEGEKLLESWRVASDKNKSEDEYGIFLKNIVAHKGFSGKIRHAIISSVVLSLTERFKIAIEGYLSVPVIVLSHKINTGIQLDVDNPKEVGGDRIANACAAYSLYQTPAVVVDFGTATTFDVVSNDGIFLGGIISPGIGISAEALSSFTSLLPKLKIVSSGSVIGKNTVDNMLSGVVRGHSAMVEGLVSAIEKELDSRVTLIATGGFSKVLSECLNRQFDYVNPNLTLEGLRIIHSLNQNQVLK